MATSCLEPSPDREPATSATTSASTDTFTITGGAGRFAGASGTLTETIESSLASLDPTSEIVHDAGSARGTITYQQAAGRT
jgi:hypothetical protein